MHESLNGKASKKFTGNGGQPLLAQSSRYPEAKINAGARAVYSKMMLGLISYDLATAKLQHKCRQIAIAVLDAAATFEDHYP